MNFLSDAPQVLVIAIFILLGAAALQDMITGQMSHWFAIGLVGLSLGWAVNEGALNLVVTNGLVALGALILTLILFTMGAMGGGAAKMFPAAAFVVGLDGLLTFVIGTFIAGGLIALVAILWQRARRTARDARVPFGPAILAGAISSMVV